jgi:hypothetical protein
MTSRRHHLVMTLVTTTLEEKDGANATIWADP